MTDLKRTIRCSNCGGDSTIYLNSELEMRELVVAGKCTKCGSTLQITYNIVGESAPAKAEEAPSEQVVNIDESLFTPEIPSDALRDLMED